MERCAKSFGQRLREGQSCRRRGAEIGGHENARDGVSHVGGGHVGLLELNGRESDRNESTPRATSSVASHTQRADTSREAARKIPRYREKLRVATRSKRRASFECVVCLGAHAGCATGTIVDAPADMSNRL